MFSVKTMRKLAIVLLVCLVLMLSIRMVLNHHICSDADCLICRLIGSLSERIFLAVCKWKLPGSALSLLLLCAAGMVLRQSIPTLVMQKVKITS